MSFYGNVLYELADAFSKVAIRNNGRTNYVVSNSYPDGEIAAAGLGGKLTLDTGNRWIGLTYDADSQTITIWHKKAETTDVQGTLATAEKVKKTEAAQAEKVTELDFGDYIKLTSATHDNTGHINGTKDLFFQLPESSTELDIQDIKDRMTKIENTNEELSQDIADAVDQSNSLKDAQSSLEEKIKTNEKNITTINNEKIGSSMNYSFSRGDKTLYRFLGPAVDTYLYENLGGASSIKEGFEKLKEIADSASSTATNTNLVLDIIIGNLCDQLESKLADEGVNITIDRAALKQTD